MTDDKIRGVVTVLKTHTDLIQLAWDAAFVAQFGTEKDKQHLNNLIALIADLKELVVSGLNYRTGA